MSAIYSDKTDKLFKGILQLETIDDCYRFFEDLCTVNEIMSMSQRFDVAHLLSEGKTFAQICNDGGVSTATISRVNRCLHYGSDGYKRILERMKNKEIEK